MSVSCGGGRGVCQISGLTPWNLQSVRWLAPSCIFSVNVCWAPIGPRDPPGIDAGRPRLEAGPLGVPEGPPHGGASVPSPPGLRAPLLPSPRASGGGSSPLAPGAERGAGSAAPPGPTPAAVPGMGVLDCFLLANMHLALIIYVQHLWPPNVLSGFGRSRALNGCPRRREGGQGTLGEQWERGS